MSGCPYFQPTVFAFSQGTGTNRFFVLLSTAGLGEDFFVPLRLFLPEKEGP